MSFKSNCRTAVFACLLYGTVAFAQPFEEKAVAAVIVAEAGNQGERGMTAVGEVIHQRKKESGISILEVLKKRRAFSCLNETTLDALVRKFEGTEEFMVALRIAEKVCRRPEQLPGITHRANHFTRTDEKPYWARGKIPVAVIGQHSFYRLR